MCVCACLCIVLSVATANLFWVFRFSFYHKICKIISDLVVVVAATLAAGNIATGYFDCLVASLLLLLLLLYN